MRRPAAPTMRPTWRRRTSRHWALRRRRVSTPAITLAVAAAVGVATAGCAVIPRGGPVTVREAVERRGPFDDPYLRIIPQGPQRGWQPTRIVEGFLDASASFEGGHQIARQYLAPQLRGAWRPTSVDVYDALTVSLAVASPSSEIVVAVSGKRVAKIESDGQYVPERPGSPVDIKLTTAKVGGEYRITKLPPTLQNALLLGSGDVQRAYRALNLYFFEPELSVLVPDPVYMPLRNRRDLPTALVSRLVSGPTGWLGPAVRNTFPSGTRLRAPVNVDGTGVATVDLTAEAARADLRHRAAYSAQLMWTLRQFPEVEAMRLLIGGEPVEIPGVSGDGNQTRELWITNNPDGLSSSSRGYYIRAGRLLELDSTDPGGEARPVRPERIGLHRPAISLGPQYLAGLSGDDDAVLIGQLTRGPLQERLRVSDRGASFTQPSWDRYGNVWTAESGPDHTRVWMLPGTQADARPVDVDIPVELSRGRIVALRMARDGARVAIILDTGDTSQVQLGRVVRDPKTGRVAVEEFQPLGAELDQVRDLAWYDANRIAAIATDGDAGAVYLVPVNGGGSAPRPGLGEPQTIAAAPEAPLLTGARSGGGDQICYLREELGSWQCEQRTGAEPAYPG
jgi:hypothetical protein